MLRSFSLSQSVFLWTSGMLQQLFVNILHPKLAGGRAGESRINFVPSNISEMLQLHWHCPCGLKKPA